MHVQPVPFCAELIEDMRRWPASSGMVTLVKSLLCRARQLSPCRAFCAQARSRVTGRKPEDYFQFASLPDPVVCGDLYPRVAIQLPMFNERAVCQAAIDSACEQTWPKGRLFVQVNLRPLIVCCHAGGCCQVSVG